MIWLAIALGTYAMVLSLPAVCLVFFGIYLRFTAGLVSRFLDPLLSVSHSITTGHLPINPYLGFLVLIFRFYQSIIGVFQNSTRCILSIGI